MFDNWFNGIGSVMEHIRIFETIQQMGWTMKRRIFPKGTGIFDYLKKVRAKGKYMIALISDQHVAEHEAKRRARLKRRALSFARKCQITGRIQRIPRHIVEGFRYGGVTNIAPGGGRSLIYRKRASAMVAVE